MASLGAEFGFPTVYWSAWDVDATFVAGEILPEASAGKLYAVIVHCFFGDNLVLADIRGRGPTVPSGRIEAGETIDQTAEREVYEETGGRLHPVRRKLVGCTVTKSRSTPSVVRYSPVLIADIVNFDKIPDGSESDGFILVQPEQLADSYYTWDPLLEAEFEFILERRAELFRAGISLAEFTGSES